jgi:hypothetical protein
MDKGLFEAYSEVIEESWGGMAMNRPPLKGGTQAPQDTRNTLSSASSKIGIEQGSLYNQSQASGSNPYEQEESKSIDKQRIYDIIDYLLKDLDSSKITDRTAVMILGKLQNILNKT